MKSRLVLVLFCIAVVVAMASYIVIAVRNQESRESLSSEPSDTLVRNPSIDIVCYLSDMSLWKPGATDVTMWVSSRCAKLRHRRSAKIEEMEYIERRFFENLVEIEGTIDFAMVRRLLDAEREQLDDTVIRAIEAKGVRVVTVGELKRIKTEYGEEWQEIHAQKFGKRLSLFSFSDPIFSKNNEVAIVVYSRLSGTLGFESGVVVLKKDRENWKFVGTAAWLIS